MASPAAPPTVDLSPPAFTSPACALAAGLSTCPLCTHLLLDPIALPCGHAFCRHCFEAPRQAALHAARLSPKTTRKLTPRRIRPRSHTSTVLMAPPTTIAPLTPFRCPACRQPMALQLDQSSTQPCQALAAALQQLSPDGIQDARRVMAEDLVQQLRDSHAEALRSRAVAVAAVRESAIVAVDAGRLDTITAAPPRPLRSRLTAAFHHLWHWRRPALQLLGPCLAGAALGHLVFWPLLHKEWEAVAEAAAWEFAAGKEVWRHRMWRLCARRDACLRRAWLYRAGTLVSAPLLGALLVMGIERL